MKGFVQDPQATLDYTIDWGPWLGDDTISTSSWTAESPMVIESGGESKTDDTTTLFLSGGLAGGNYIITNTINTIGGREDERSFKMKIRNR